MLDRPACSLYPLSNGDKPPRLPQGTRAGTLARAQPILLPKKGSPMSAPSQHPALAMLARHFEHFATREFPGTSPLYEQLSRHIARDSEILALAAHATSRPVPNLLLGAVHYLLLQGAE